MKMIKPKKGKKLSVDCGDILYGEEYLRKFTQDELEKAFYAYPFEMPFNMEDSEFKEQFVQAFQYECPFIEGNKYFWFFPFTMFTNTRKEQHWWNAYMDSIKKDAIDQIKSWQDQRKYEDDYVEDHYYESIYLGHGYTHGTFPSDGNNSKEMAAVEMENGDLLIGKVFIWYNK